MSETNRRRLASLTQYEPLKTPEKWQDDEKRFALRLTQLLDELFEKQSAMLRRIAALEKAQKE